jgi:pimeloyl-ACP methyl ester carboxylesterase
VFPAVAGLSVPPPLRGRARPLETLAANGITDFYWQYFQEPGRAEAEFERDLDFTMRAVVSRGFSEDAALHVDPAHGFLGDPARHRPLPDWIGEADIAEFVAGYRVSGFRGGLNWYRNLDRNWDLTAAWQDAKIAQPSLFIAGSLDSVVTGVMGKKRISDMERVATDLKAKIIIEGAGHWIQQERSDAVNRALIDFLKAVWPAQ